MPRIIDFESASPYEILGVSPHDDFKTIRAAWLRLVKTWHPDVWYGTHEEATRRMAAVNDAYDRLSVVHNRCREELARQERQEQAARDQAAKPRGEARRPARVRRAAQPVPVREERSIVRPGRPNPAEGRFDAARAVFAGRTEARVQAFA